MPPPRILRVLVARRCRARRRQPPWSRYLRVRHCTRLWLPAWVLRLKMVQRQVVCDFFKAADPIVSLVAALSTRPVTWLPTSLRRGAAPLLHRRCWALIPRFPANSYMGEEYMSLLVAESGIMRNNGVYRMVIAVRNAMHAEKCSTCSSLFRTFTGPARLSMEPET